MNYTMTAPCAECPFLRSMGFTFERLSTFAGHEFPCHKTAKCDEDTGDFLAKAKSLHCAGALIFNEKREQPHQMMRIAGRVGLYDPAKLDMNVDVGSDPVDYRRPHIGERT